MTDPGRAERHALEIEALGNEILNRIPDAVRVMRDYKRGYPTGGDGPPAKVIAELGSCTRTEALALAGPDAIDREQRELDQCLDRALRALQTAYNICARYQRAARPTKPEAQTNDEGWCSSCIRDGGYLEPAAAGRYAALCRFCGEWLAANGTNPPMEILKARHEGRRITTQMADKALANGGRR